jgi:histidyl-tRNA synthetase
LALHFDLTVPLARYVAQNYGDLTFPFKRYQIQKVWRGERPQVGRFREFYQADVDVIAEDKLPLHFDAEMPALIHDLFRRLGIRACLRINNRKVLRGYYEGLGLPEERIPDLLREVDKLEKTGAEAVLRALEGLELDPRTAVRCLDLSRLKGSGPEVAGRARALGVKHPLLEEGLEELEFVAGELKHLPSDEVVFDLGIVRGLDYYTGTIYETTLPEHPSLGSICSGGRYENLASEFINRKLPGVGISIGLSRLMAHLFGSGTLSPSRQTPTQVLVCWPSPDLREACRNIALELRSAGIPTEVYHEPQALKKQVRYADRKGIPYVLFPHAWTPEQGRVEVKELATGAQTELPLAEWCAGRTGRG